MCKSAPSCTVLHLPALAYVSASNEMWFGSDKIYKYNGSGWAEETGTVGSEIQMIRMLNANEGFAVTGNGTILKR